MFRPTNLEWWLINWARPLLINITANMEVWAHKYRSIQLVSQLNNLLIKLKTLLRRSSLFQNHCLRTIPTDLLFFQLNTMIFGRCTKNKWLASGLQKKSILPKTPKIGKSSLQMNNISSSMFLLSSLPVTVSFLRTLHRDSWPKYKSQRQDASTVSKWWWRTSILRHTHCWLILTSKTTMRRCTSSKPSRIFHQSLKRQNGPWDGLVQTQPTLRDLLLLLASKESSSLVASVPSFGLRREDWCQDSPFQMNLSAETKVCTLILPA